MWAASAGPGRAMGEAGMAKWNEQSLRMDDDHTWRSKPGYQIFVVDRGAARFDFPTDWVVVANEEGVRLHDKQPPDDSCVLQISVFYLPPGLDLSELPPATLLAQALDARDDDDETLGRTPIAHVLRPGLEIVWSETRRIDPGEHREARSRHLLAKAGDIQVFVSLEFWPEDGERLGPVWDEVLRSLRVGEFVADPRKGPPRRRRR